MLADQRMEKVVMNLCAGLNRMALKKPLSGVKRNLVTAIESLTKTSSRYRKRENNPIELVA
jgi:hypothetical protein